MKSGLAILFLAVVLCVASCAKKTDEDVVVAHVGNHKITLAHFLRSYRDEITKTPVQVQDSPQLRRDHLNTLITRYFLAQEATAAKLQDLPGFKKAMQAESTAVIIHGLFEEEIANKLEEISEAELQDAYKKASVKYHARHLLAKTKSAADSLYQRLQKGENFETLAKECFRDSSLKNSGGDLGWGTWGDWDIDFENAVFNLQIGQYSQPIETKYGWHIIKLENISYNPILREGDYQVHRESIRNRLRQRLLKQQADLRIKKLMQEKRVRMNVPLISLLEKEQRRLKNGGMIQIADVREIPDSPLENLLDRYQNEIILSYDGGKWTVGNFRAYLYTVSPDAIGHGIYRSVAMSLRNYFLLQEAEDKRIDKVKEVKNEIDEKREHLLSATFMATYADTCTFSDADYRDYFERNKKKLYPAARLATLSFEDVKDEIAKQVQRARKTEAFRKMKQKYVNRPEIKINEEVLLNAF